MESRDGPTLKEYLAEKGKLSWNETSRIRKPVLTSLAEIHKSNIIHRDISPDNIKLVNDGKVKLLDFGAAREISKKDIKSLDRRLRALRDDVQMPHRHDPGRRDGADVRG